MQKASRHFYQFLGLHSFLIGLFPFFIPVYLWKEGVSLSGISFFICLTGLGFCLALWLLDRIWRQVSFRYLLAASFALEFLLLTAVFAENRAFFLPAFALLNGAYNCFFWIIQRLLFYETISPENSGMKFGNFQIFVLIVLKAGIFTGGVLLEQSGFFPLYLVSGCIAVFGVFFFLVKPGDENFLSPHTLEPPLALLPVIHFKDAFHSKTIFALDGVFLFLESYFWVISLFLFVRESFWKLGMLVIVLALTFGVLFLIIKNTIDRAPNQKVYLLTVILYGVSWILRGSTTAQLSQIRLYAFLIIITFCTSLFRLAFNKRFFDRAKETIGYRYILLKSYYSQFFIAIGFSTLGILFSAWRGSPHALPIVYWGAAVISPLYLLYRYSLNRKIP